MGIDVFFKYLCKICCVCLDWSECCFYLGGYVGVVLFLFYEFKGWLIWYFGYCEVIIMEKGYAVFKIYFHI